jgi:CBS domain-containing protein
MKRKKTHLVEDYMSSAVISMRETDTIRSAEFEMTAAEIRHIPVIDDRSHVIGVLSNRDLIRALARAGSKPIPVGEMMTRAVRTVRATTPAHEAATLMIELKIGCLPVVGEDEQLVGIITETDFLEVAARALRGAEIGRAGED